MSDRTLATTDLLESLALSGTASVTIPIPANTQNLTVAVSAQYAAVAATSGIQAAFLTSVDGTTFVAANEKNITVAPAATVLGQGKVTFRLGSDPYRLDEPSYLNSIKVTLTNLDATNAAVVAVSHEAANFSL